MKKFLIFIISTAFIYSCTNNNSSTKPSINPSSSSSSTNIGATPNPNASLYDRIGGKDGIDAIVNDLMDHISADPDMDRLFAGVKSDPNRMQNLKDRINEQLCVLAKGPCKYNGTDMTTAHKGMNITEAEFNSFIADLTLTLDKFKIVEPEKSEILKPLNDMKSMIVGK